MDIEFPFIMKIKASPEEEMDEEYYSRLLSKALDTFEYIFEKQSEILTENNQNSLYYDMELPLSLVLVAWSIMGLR